MPTRLWENTRKKTSISAPTTTGLLSAATMLRKPLPRLRACPSKTSHTTTEKWYATMWVACMDMPKTWLSRTHPRTLSTTFLKASPTRPPIPTIKWTKTIASLPKESRTMGHSSSTTAMDTLELTALSWEATNASPWCAPLLPRSAACSS